MDSSREDIPLAHSKPFTLASPNSFGGELQGFVSFPDDKFPGLRPVVVICHGFKGFMEWGFFPPLADLLTERGFITIRFNYSGSGMSPGDDLVTDTDAFKRNTFSLERDETLLVLDAVEELGEGRANIDQVGLLGHSRGGGAVVLAAAAAGSEKVRALVTWSAISTFQRYAKNVDEWRRDGAIPLRNGRTGQELELGLELLDDLEQNTEALDLEAASAKVKTPWLVVHGDQDETVPVSEAEDLASWAGGEKELTVIQGGSHTFGARHPFAGPTAELIRAMNATQVWFRRHLS